MTEQEDAALEREGLNPAPVFRTRPEAADRDYITNRVQGCHFPWLNPR